MVLVASAPLIRTANISPSGVRTRSNSASWNWVA
jgi:hypothetical protein